MGCFSRFAQLQRLEPKEPLERTRNQLGGKPTQALLEPSLYRYVKAHIVASLADADGRDWKEIEAEAKRLVSNCSIFLLIALILLVSVASNCGARDAATQHER